MAEHIGLKLPLDHNLQKFSRLLWQRGVPHRIAEESGVQVLRVGSEREATAVKALYQQLIDGDISLLEAPNSGVTPKILRPTGAARNALRSTPGVLVLLALSLAGAGLVALDKNFQWLSWLTFYRVDFASGLLWGDWPIGQPWRLLTPIFLHFGLLHIVFNGLWLWELGGMIERRQGLIRLLGLVVIVAGLSNMAQAMASVSIFGGMSGVIYGLLGYIAIWNKMRPQQRFPLPKAVVVFMVAWLLLCYTGFAALLGAGDIANTAHASGLVMGVLLGLAAALLDKRPQS